MAFIHGDLTLVMVKIHATNKDQSKDQLLTLFCFSSGIISGVLVDDIAIFTRIKFILPRWIRRCWARSLYSFDGFQYDGSLWMVENGILPDKVI